MTIIAAAFRSPDDYALASDSEGVKDGQRIPNVKAWRWGSALIGMCGSLAMGQRGAFWLRQKTDPDKMPEATRDGIAATLLTMHGYLLEHAGSQHPGNIHDTGVQVLLACPLGIASMDTGGAVVWHDGYFAIGAGAAFALGAMFAEWEERPGLHMDVLASAAVRAALHWSSDCFGSPVILSCPS